MKLLISILFGVFAASSAMASSSWTCKVDDQHSLYLVKLNLESPTFTLIHRYEEADGTVSESSEELITTTKVSKLKMDRSKCSEAAPSTDGQNYNFRFSCSLANVHLHFHVSEKNGAYLENIKAGSTTSRSIIFKDCVESKP